MLQNWLTWFKISSFLLLLSACATKPVEKPAPSYSAATEATFEEIERARALEYYRELRNRGNPDVPAPSRPQVVKPKPYVEFANKPRAPKPKPELSPEAKEALERELGQNLSYFCMLNRKDPRFSDEAECHAYAQNVLHDCRQREEGEISRKLVTCIKRELKL